MRNPLLEQVTLRALRGRTTAAPFWTIADSVSLELQQPELTTDEFLRTLQLLEERKLISKEKDLLGYSRWSITDLGKTAITL